MDNQVNAQQDYEMQLVYHLLIFLKAMEQYRIWGKRAVSSDVLRRDPQFETGMRRLLEAMSLCSHRFLDLPEPPNGGREADLLIRDLGQVVGRFTKDLETLLTAANPAEREMLTRALAEKSKEIKQSYRQFAELYNQAFPGRLDLTMQSLRSSESPEMQG